MERNREYKEWTNIVIYLSDEQMKQVWALSESNKLSPTEIVRQLIDIAEEMDYIDWEDDITTKPYRLQLRITPIANDRLKAVANDMNTTKQSIVRCLIQNYSEGVNFMNKEYRAFIGANVPASLAGELKKEAFARCTTVTNLLIKILKERYSSDAQADATR